MFGVILTLAVAGLILVIAEMFLPGMVAGTLGGLALAAAVLLSYYTYGFETGNILLVVFVAGGFVLFLWWLYFFPRSAFVKKLTLDAISGAPGDHSARTALLGREGVALTQLRPAGTAMIGGKRIDVLAGDGFVAAQEHIKVVQVEGVKVIVRKQST